MNSPPLTSQAPPLDPSQACCDRSTPCCGRGRPKQIPRPSSHWATPGKHEDVLHTCMRRFYFPFLLHYHWHVLAGWLVVLALSAAYGPSFFSLTKSDFSLPAGTPSEVAGKALGALYPSFSGYPAAFVIHTTGAAGGVTSAGVAPLSMASSAALRSFCAKYPAAVSTPMGYWELSALGPSMSTLAAATISPNNATMRTTISFLVNASITEVNKFADALLKFTAGQSNGPLKVAATGLFPLFSEMSHATEENFALIDATVLPIAVLILGLYVKSYRHMGLALLNLVLALLLSFALLVPLTNTVNINPFAPSIMLSLGIAVCFDYSIFLITRFKEARLENFKSKEDAVFETLVSSGHVVLLAGATLLCTFVLLLGFPQNFLMSVGYSCSAVVFTSILANMSVTPSFFIALECLSYFDLYPRFSSTNCCCSTPLEDAAILARRRAGEEVGEEKFAAKVLVGGEGTLALALPSQPAITSDAQQQVQEPAAPPSPPPSRPTPSYYIPFFSTLCTPRATPERFPTTEYPKLTLWFRMAWFVSGPRMRWVMLAVIAGITAPFFMAFLSLTPSSDDYLIYLQGSSSLDALGVMQKDFPLGSLDPYIIVCATGTPGGVLTPAYFAAESSVVAEVLGALSGEGFVNPSSITALSYFQSNPISFATSMGVLLNATSPTYNTPSATAYRALAAGGINADGAAGLINIQTLINPNSQAIIPFVRKTRDILTRIAGAYAAGNPPTLGAPPLPTLQLYLVGGYTTTLDVQDALYKLVPQQVAIVLVLVLLIVGVSFGSIVLSVRLLITLFVALAWTYGLMVLVYQPGPAQTAFAQLTPSILSSVGLYWIIPLMSFSILVGFAIDYDVFLMSRVTEFRMQGWSDRTAVCLAVEKTGAVISVAGLIMAVSFVGLLIPKTIVLNQYGFSLFFGVLVDTFVVRPILVPAIFSAGGEEWNWYPRKMPTRMFATCEEELAALQKMQVKTTLRVGGKGEGKGGGEEKEEGGRVGEGEVEGEGGRGGNMAGGGSNAA